MEKGKAEKFVPSRTSRRHPQIDIRSGLRAGEDGIPCSQEKLGKYLYKLCCPPDSDDCKLVDLSVLDPSNW